MDTKEDMRMQEKDKMNREEEIQKEIEVEVNGVKAIVVIPKGFDESKIPFPIIKKEQASNHSHKGEVKRKGTGNAVLNLAEQVGASPSDTHNQTAEEYLKDKENMMLSKYKKWYAEEDVLHALKLKEQEVKELRSYADQLEETIRGIDIRKIKQQIKQELWDDINKAFQGDLEKVYPKTLGLIKKRHNLK